MKIGTVLFQQDVEGIPKPTFEVAVEVQLPNSGVDVAAKYALYAYNEEKGTHLEFVSTLAGYAAPFALGTLYAILYKAKDGGKVKVYFSGVLTTSVIVKDHLLLFVHIYG